MTGRRLLGWLAFVVVLELITRAVVYGLAPSASESSRALGGHLGGPGFVAVLLVAVGIGALLSTGAVLLASMGVRERWALAEDRPAGAPPRVAWLPLLGRALTLTVVGWLTFAAIETVIHLHEGLGFHGLECLVGPVHRNALPVVAGVALLASAALSVARLVLAWMRRTVGRLVRPRTAVRPRLLLTRFSAVSVARRAPWREGMPARGPPLVVA
ncbi:MAG: hypothetical protein ACJ762_12290 [Solirubrobacteraceae bacterium]